MKQIFTLLVLAICLNSSAQQFGYRKGFIVTKTNDTIQCLVPITSSFDEKISIKKGINNKEETILLTDVKYLVTETNVYENIAFQKKGKEIQKLMWLEIPGKLNLYLEIFITRSGSTYPITQPSPTNSATPKGQLTYFGEPIKTYVVKKSDSSFLIEEKKFIETISPLIFDNKDLLHKVETKVYKFHEIEAVIKEYNSYFKSN